MSEIQHRKRLVQMLRRIACAVAAGRGESEMSAERGGAYFRSDVFDMTPDGYCPCRGGRDDRYPHRESNEHIPCPWCDGCSCFDSGDICFVDGEHVTPDQYESFRRAEIDTFPADLKPWDYDLLYARLNARIHVVTPRRCEYCLRNDAAVTCGGGPGVSAPQFWMKPHWNIKLRWTDELDRIWEATGRLRKDVIRQIERECLREVARQSALAIPTSSASATGES